jgi:DNA repair protein RecO (recombination protein O)
MKNSLSSITTPAILIRRLDYGDFDLILTFLTLKKGKITAIAKSAKRSTKRFQGLLELFYCLDIVINSGKGKGLPVLSEASLRLPVERIGGDINKTAYASYWAELVNDYVEAGQRQNELYGVLAFVLKELNSGSIPEDVLSILFQMRFLSLSGLCPNLNQCGTCLSNVEDSPRYTLHIDLAGGGLICDSCATYASQGKCLSKGTIKQLKWLSEGDMRKAARIRFSKQAMQEGLSFLEAFVPYHLGREPKSLRFLRQIRSPRSS